MTSYIVIYQGRLCFPHNRSVSHHALPKQANLRVSLLPRRSHSASLVSRLLSLRSLQWSTSPRRGLPALAPSSALAVPEPAGTRLAANGSTIMSRPGAESAPALEGHNLRYTQAMLGSLETPLPGSQARLLTSRQTPKVPRRFVAELAVARHRAAHHKKQHKQPLPLLQAPCLHLGAPLLHGRGGEPILHLRWVSIHLADGLGQLLRPRAAQGSNGPPHPDLRRCGCPVPAPHCAPLHGPPCAPPLGRSRCLVCVTQCF